MVELRRSRAFDHTFSTTYIYNEIAPQVAHDATCEAAFLHHQQANNLEACVIDFSLGVVT